MAKEGFLFKTFAQTSVNHVPVTSVLLSGALAAILTLLGSFDTLTDYVVFAMWLFYALITGSIFVYRRKFPHLERPYRAWGYPVVPAFFVIAAACAVVSAIVTAPMLSAFGAALLVLGFVVYAIFAGRWREMEAATGD
jgi:APA family basic amino acid/polyamine antiporter